MNFGNTPSGVVRFFYYLRRFLVFLIIVFSAWCFSQNIESVIAAAKKGNAEAQFQYALLLEQGIAPSKNPEEAARNAFAMARRAARQNHLKAIHLVGNYYARGYGVKLDWKEAFGYFTKAAEMGLPEAEYKLGWCYLNGKGTTKNPAQALKWYLKAAENGITDAYLIVAEMYYTGLGTERDYDKAFRWFKAAAEKNYGEAQYRVGFYYLVGQGSIKRNLVEAHKWFIRASKNGFGDTLPDLLKKMSELYNMSPDDIKKAFAVAE